MAPEAFGVGAKRVHLRSQAPLGAVVQKTGVIQAPGAMRDRDGRKQANGLIEGFLGGHPAILTPALRESTQ